MDSSDLPFVSGNILHANNKCSNIIAEKNRNAMVPPFFISAITGKTHEITAAMNQCVKLPSDCPFERTAFGNISEMKTQITAPWENAKNAMNPIK